jgi:pantoate kinase
MHSLGMSFTVRDGVSATVAPSATFEVWFNDERIEFPTVRSAAESLINEPVKVEVRSSLSLASGFGLSGASTLATLLAINRMFDLGMADRDLAMAAHVAEVENLTGLGDVCGQFHGGCLAKLQEGDPLKASLLPVAEQAIHFRYFGPIQTSEVIGDPHRRRRINLAADVALGKLSELQERREEDLDSYIEIAREFAEKSGLLIDERVRQAIDVIEAGGGKASMIMLGNAVFSTRPFEGSRETALSTRSAALVDE